MIMVDSKAARRLAKARAKILDIERRPDESHGSLYEMLDAHNEFHLAAAALADEIIADRHHEGED